MLNFLKHIAIIFILSTFVVFSQEMEVSQLQEKKETKTEKTSKETEKSVKQNQGGSQEEFLDFKDIEKKEKFIDKDGDGINDLKVKEKSDKSNQDLKEKGKNRDKGIRGNDRFIDADGDGINDNRCRGMGLHNGKQRGARNCFTRGGKK